MKTRRLVSFFAAIAMCITVISCKKDGGDKNASCRIVTVTQVLGGSTYLYNLTYNNDGKVSTLTGSGATNVNKVYTYAGNNIIINATLGGTFYSRDSITLNANGTPANIRQFSNPAGTAWINHSLEYNGNDLLKQHMTTNLSAVPITSIVTMSNGNVINLKQVGSTEYNMEYFTDKGVQRGDFLEIVGLLNYGINIYPHKNLVKALALVGGAVTNYNYEFNADGLISVVTATSGTSVSTISYQYACN